MAFKNKLIDWFAETGRTRRQLAEDAELSIKTIDNFRYGNLSDISMITAMKIKKATRIKGHPIYKNGLDAWDYIEPLHVLREMQRRKK